MLGRSWTMYKFSEVSLILIMWSILRFRRWAMPWICSDCRQSPLCGTICIRVWNMELCKYRMWFLPPLVLLVMTIFLVSQLQLPWSAKWLNISIGTDEFGALNTYTKVLWVPWSGRIGACLRPSLGKSYWNKKGTKAVKIDSV